ncbi:FAD-binding oxidoreductase [Streptomyces sp. NBC_00555]|uniref:NAD(P)/FAD-dependent oxidoreductase n=1 Tax=Streptomyces sp. NBC_00555 TaxID=2903662 RepID=UPI00224CDA56|nr:FAD-dependent oxidoreductase [Streptomyces sp. NBC_00555]MCX5011188.1 FAD-binding oxidoreductase [Streptomyces sp. NBC_00555]
MERVTTPPRQRQDPAAYDVAVVGGGVLGLSIAQEFLSREPQARVVVLERDAVGSGATRRSAGLHFPRGSSHRIREMAALSQERYAALKAARPELPIHSLDMTVVAPASAQARLEETYLPQARLRPVREVAGKTAVLPEGTAAWEGDGCQYADVQALTQLLARDLRRTVEFREGVEVTAVTPGADSVELSLSTGVPLHAGQVVLAPGPWLAAPGWKDLVSPLGARVKKIVALHIEVPPSVGDRAVVFQDEDAFLLPYHERGHWLFSYTCQKWDVDPDTVATSLTPADRDAALAVLARYAPHLIEHCVSGRVFCDAYGPDFEPLVRPLTADGRVVFAGAASGSGYRLAPAIAAETAHLLFVPSPGKDDVS